MSAAPKTVDIWRVDLDEAGGPSGREDTLSAAERATAARFRFDQDRRRYITAHAALRHILSEYLGCGPNRVTFVNGEKGKPALSAQHAALHFNLSHSGKQALVAVATMNEVGVDIEHHRPLEALGLLASQCFSTLEMEMFNALQEEQRLVGFFNAWTRKEAFIKALGEGLSHPLQQFSVSLIPGQRCRLLEVQGHPEEPAAWTLQSLDVGRGYSAAVAIRAAEIELRCWNYCLEQEFAYVRR